MFNDGQINWGRIIVAFAWMKRLHDMIPHYNDCFERVADIVCPWVSAQRGEWNDCIEFLKEESFLERLVQELVDVFTVLF
jgi:hypothetical protein